MKRTPTVAESVAQRHADADAAELKRTKAKLAATKRRLANLERTLHAGRGDAPRDDQGRFR